MTTRSLIKNCRRGHQMVLEYDVVDGAIAPHMPTRSVPFPEAPDEPDLLMRICWCGEVVLATPPEVVRRVPRRIERPLEPREPAEPPEPHGEPPREPVDQ